MTGIIYVLTNPSMPGLIKIGRTDRELPIERMSELFSTGVPEPFECVGAYEVQDSREVERIVHTTLNQYRVSPRREFFRVPPQDAIIVIESQNPRDVTSYLSELLDARSVSEFRRPVQDFIEMGYSLGDKFDYGSTGDSIELTNSNRFICDNQVLSFSAAANYMKAKHRGTNGKAEFSFRGEKISNRYNQIYGQRL